MILSDDEIKAAIDNGEIIIDPSPEPDQYSASSLDLRLGDEFFSWDVEKIDRLQKQGLGNILDPSRMTGFNILSADFMSRIACDNEGCCVIQPKEFILGVTYERIQLPIESKIAARVEGRRYRMTTSTDNSQNAFVLVSSFYKGGELEPEGMITLVDGKLSAFGYHEHGQRLTNSIVSQSIHLEGKTIDPV